MPVLAGVPELRDRREQIAEIQRGRLLGAAVRAVDELGYAQVTVAHVTGRARVSRRTFYELFATREECLMAALQDAVARAQAELEQAGLDGLSWVERVRAGLWLILCFLDREPALARLCVVQSLRGGPAMLQHRERLLARLAEVVDEGRACGERAERLPALTAQGVVGAALGIVYSRLLSSRREPLCALQTELMAMIVLPYLGVAAARKEQARPVPSGVPRTAAVEQVEGDPLEGLEMRVTYRTARVLEGVSELPGSSNRQVADYAGIHDQGQVSRLLARLRRLGLLTNGERRVKGEPNTWRLTPRGERVTQSIRTHPGGLQPASRRGKAVILRSTSE